MWLGLEWPDLEWLCFPIEVGGAELMHMMETGQAQSKVVVAALSWWLADDIGHWLLVLL